MGILDSVASLSVQAATAAAQAAEETERLFGLDYQTIFDTVFTMVNVLILYLFLKYVLFIPLRKLLDERKQRINEQNAKTQSDLETVEKLKAEYQQKLQQANKEADSILSESRQAALKKEQKVLDEAKLKAASILAAARKEAKADRVAAEDSVKNEIKGVASAMAGKITGQKIDTTVSDALLNETLKKVGDGTC
ncbi:MAG: ATP synthase F0 subunit B [Clostridia bacterium]|nr:ATP synthase F0 subunit B [Clostridia bacterium]